jgi:hypothetical protein
MRKHPLLVTVGVLAVACAVAATAALADTPVTVGSGWFRLVAHEAGVPSSPPAPFTFTSTSPVLLTVTDLFCIGDRYTVSDGTVTLGTTSPSATPDCPPDEPSTVDAALADPRYSHGRFALGPGAHAIGFVLTTAPFGDGAGMAFRLDPLTTASCENGGWQAITATPAFTSEADCIAFVGADTTPPVIGPHADVVTNATGPTGAVVTYAPPTASDPDDAVASIGCTPASGTTFAIGSTTVTCTATDTHANSATSSFVVHVRGADEQLTDLSDAVAGVGPGRSLAAKLVLAEDYLAAANLSDTCSTLTAFINQVKAQTGKTIPTPEATTLIADARQIKTLLGC